MCESLDLKTSKIIPFSKTTAEDKKETPYYNLLIQAREEIKRFLELINPMK